MDTTATDRLWRHIHCVYGIRIAHRSVCEGHSSPFGMFAEQLIGRPSLALWHGPRGGGKSFLSALDTHITSRFEPGHATRILGGSKAQSEQVYRALRAILEEHRGVLGGDGDQVARRKLLAQSATYRNGSEVSILAASATSVRGPHVPSLKLDEVDEIDPDIREQAMGMAMDSTRGGRTQKTSILMTSTWHRSNGPMAMLKERASAGEFPSHTFCVFEVLERCPRERSGRWVGGTQKYENCPACPIRQWCHADCGAGQPLPKAKRSSGHYSIDSLVQKARVVSAATMRSDYLCGGPQSDGLWFPDFSDEPGGNVTEEAEYLPGLPVHCPIDSGDYTGGVFFQVEAVKDGGLAAQRIRVFAEYYSKGRGPGWRPRSSWRSPGSAATAAWTGPPPTRPARRRRRSGPSSWASMRPSGSSPPPGPATPVRSARASTSSPASSGPRPAAATSSSTPGANASSRPSSTTNGGRSGGSTSTSRPTPSTPTRT